jgi:hypothetical protein
MNDVSFDDEIQKFTRIYPLLDEKYEFLLIRVSLHFERVYNTLTSISPPKSSWSPVQPSAMWNNYLD